MTLRPWMDMEQPAAPVSLESLLAHRAWVRQVARALVIDESRAEDLEQEAWLEVLRRPPRDARSLRGWLGTVVRHKAADAGRSEARRRTREEGAARPEAMPGAADLVAEADLHQRLVRAVLDLEEPYRSTLLLRYFEDLGPAAIAERGGIPLETVRTRLRRGLEALRERFDREAGGDRRAWLRLMVPLALGGKAVCAGAAAVTAGALAGGLKSWSGIAAILAIVAAGTAFWVAGPLEPESPAPGGMALAASQPPGNAPPPNPRGEPPAAPGETVATKPPAAVPPPAAPAPPTPTPGTPGPSPAPAPRAEEVAGTATLEVLVVDAHGRPVPGARVKIHGPGRSVPNFDLAAVAMDPPVPRPAIREGAADGAGRFAGMGLPAGSYWARAMGEGAAPATMLVRITDEKAGARARLLLVPEVVLQGTVRRADGTPAPGVGVVARRFTDWSLVAFDRTTVVAGPDGAYRIGGLAPGVYEILLSPSPDLLLSAGAVEVPQVSSFDPGLSPGATIRGRVLDDASGMPLPGATVRLSGSDPLLKRQHGARTRTGPDGTYRIEGFPGGTSAWIRVRKEGYLPSFDGGSDPGARLQGIAAGGEYLRDVRLARGGRVKGRVRDPDGKPVAGAWLTVEAYTDHGMQESPVGVSGEDGAFTIEPVLPADGILMASAAGFTQRDVGDASAWDLIRERAIPPSAAVSVRGGETAEKDLVLEPAPGLDAVPPPPTAILAGRVLRPDGAPPKDLRLRLLREEEGSSPYWNLRKSRPVAVGEDGTFRIEGLPPARYSLAARADGCALAVGPWVALENGGIRDGYALSLAPGGSISGTVVDAAGEPVRGAGISVERIAEDHFLAVTDARGRFTVSELAEGSWVVTALVAGAEPESATAATGASDVVLGIRRPGLLRGKVVDAETGAPLPDITIIREGLEEWGSVDARTSRDGTFTLPAGSGGPGEITAGLRSGNQAAESDYVPEVVEFAETPPGEIRIALRKGLSIAGRVLAQDGTPHQGRLRIHVDGESDPGWPFFRWTWFLVGELDGTFRVRGLPPGTYNLVFEDDADPGFTPIQVAGVRSGTTDLVLRPGRALPVEGRVVDEEDRPPGVPGRIQPLVRGDERGRIKLPTVEVGPDGTFRTVAVPVDGIVDLLASHFEGFLEARVESVEPGTTGVVVRIRRGAVVSGRVVDPAGQPVPAGVPVRAFPPLAEGKERGAFAGETATAGDGTFTLRGLPGEEFLVEAGGLGSDFLPAEPMPPVKAGARDVVLPVRRGLTVEVVILGEGDVVLFHVRQGERMEVFHPEEGKVVIRGLEPGMFRIRNLFGQRDLGEFDASAGRIEIRLR